MTRDDLKRLAELSDQSLGEMVCVHFTVHEKHVGEFKAKADLAAQVPKLNEVIAKTKSIANSLQQTVNRQNLLLTLVDRDELKKAKDRYAIEVAKSQMTTQ